MTAEGTSAFERLIALEGAVNFRDLGGYATADGRHSRWRVLFRADGLADLTEVDLGVLRSLGIRTVIDLRTPHEHEQGRFDRDAHPVEFFHFPFFDTVPDAEQWNLQPGVLGSKYTEMLDGAGAQIAAALEVLAQPAARPAVFHCTAGKDRTGLLSAIVLSLLGVPDETVVADYALSGPAMERLRVKLMEKYPDSRESIAGIEEAFSADPANMVGLLLHLRERYGSIESYAAAIGVGDGTLAALREALLE